MDGAKGQWDATTPCAPWTVADIVQHAIDTERSFLDQRGLPLPEAAPASGGDGDPGERWRAHSRDVTAVLARDGVAQTQYDGYFGPTTVAATMADFYGWDLVIHGWDIARATGQDWALTEDEVRQLSATADGWGPALYSDGVCGPAVDLPAGASAQDRLLARLGRDPSWTPGRSVSGQR